jgi:hypothetical protein
LVTGASGQAERGEHRWLLEGGDVDQTAVFEAQYGEHEQRERGLARTAEVPGCAWLPRQGADLLAEDRNLVVGSLY